MSQTVRVGERCPGCGVICADLDAEHLNGCRYQGRDALRLTLTAEDRESVQSDLDDERARLTRLQDVEPLKGLEGVRRAAVAVREKYILRLERMLEEG